MQITREWRAPYRPRCWGVPPDSGVKEASWMVSLEQEVSYLKFQASATSRFRPAPFALREPRACTVWIQLDKNTSSFGA